MVPPRSPFAWRFSRALPLSYQRHQADHRLRCGAELRRVGVLDAGKIALRLDHRHLHAETDAEIRHVAFAGELCRADFPVRAALAETAPC